MRQDTDCQFELPPPLFVVTFTVREIVAPGATVTVVLLPLNVTELTVRESVNVPVTDKAEVSPTAV
jgi:hypothetical protein